MLKINLFHLKQKTNNYGYKDQQIEEVKKNLKDRNQIPDHLDTSAKMQRFYKKWSQFMINDDKLFYKKLNLEVIPDDGRKAKMKELYENNVIGVSRSITMFYHTISFRVRVSYHGTFSFSDLYLNAQVFGFYLSKIL